jgi:nucleoside-diphosphate-sugar epimerase
MLHDRKILVTGLTGQIAFPMAQALAAANEVWGIARFSEPGSRERVEAAGITTRTVDLGDGDFGDLPDDFTHLLHLAAFQLPGDDYDHALRVNAEGTGLLLAHCRRAEAALVASTFSVYEPNPDPWHRFREDDPLGNQRQPHAATYSISKLGQEAVARAAARMLGLPVTIARINAAYGPAGGLPAYHLDWLRAGLPVSLRAPGPTPYSPIHQDDMNAQVGALLAAASVPATIVNWAGDDVVAAEEWIGLLADRLGVTADIRYADNPSGLRGIGADVTRRRSITGPCTVDWRAGIGRLVDERAADGAAAERLRAAYDTRGTAEP